MKLGDKVYTWSNERYGQSYITECIIEGISGDDLYLYAVEENRAFYRNKNDVLSLEDLKNNLKRLNL